MERKRTGRLLAAFVVALVATLVLGLMSGMSLKAHADTEKSETISTTEEEVDGIHFTISNNEDYADSDGMRARDGITVTPKNNEYITKVVITCGYFPEEVSDDNTAVSSGIITIENNTITITDVNASSFTFWCGGSNPLFNPFVVYYLDSAPGHSVTISSGNNMTWVQNTGAESQTGITGTMTPVVYTANEGYYFPESYSVTPVSGISVTRNSYTQITVSGTPTADASITLTAPTAKTKPDAPTTAAAVDCTTTDNNDGKLTGVTTAMEYKKSDATDWIAGTGIDITGLVPGTYYVRLKATDTTTASDNQELTIAEYTIPTYEVTYKVVNGTWSDDTTKDKKETVQSGSTPASVPTGMKAAEGYEGGAWDTDPTEATITGKATFTYSFTAKSAPSTDKEMYRLYNPNSGEHFYTANAAERDNVKNAGWTYEGVGWTAPKSGSPVYRLYNEYGGEHHYTTSKGEHDSLVAVGWKDEGVGWYSGGSKPLYRQYNPNAFANNHNFTVSTNERDTLVGLGWRDEGVAWYGI